MAQKTILSGRKVKSRAALLEMTLQELNDAAGFGPNYIYRLWGSENVQLSTINKLALALNCNACDLMEVAVEESANTQSDGLARVTV